MLKLKYLFENYELAKEALQYWTHDCDTLDNALRSFRISSNAIYPFFQEKALCFVRLAPTEEKLEQNLLGELEFLEYLRRADYPALRPLPASTGDTLLRLDTRWGAYYACAFGAVPGTALEDVPLTPAVIASYGQALGQLHALSRAYTPQTRKWVHGDALNWAKKVLLEYDAPAPALRALRDTRARLAALPVTEENYGLIHYDFETDNVFWDTETETCSAIDFDDGMYHWYALDVEQALDSLSESVEEAAFPAAKAEFLRGYREAYPFPAEAEDTLPLMRQFIAVFGYARVVRCVAERFDNEPEWLTELRGKLAWRMQRDEAFFRQLRP
ncbi:MAG: phosphotransferase [Eubacteriales bacterium]|nr:phosphotransferase [Eubacteriales bacterium]